jgi:hypothetical protein
MRMIKHKALGAGFTSFVGNPVTFDSIADRVGSPTVVINTLLRGDQCQPQKTQYLW